MPHMISVASIQPRRAFILWVMHRKGNHTCIKASLDFHIVLSLLQPRAALAMKVLWFCLGELILGQFLLVLFHLLEGVGYT